MPTLYTYGSSIFLTPAQFNSYTTIQDSPTDPTAAVYLYLTQSGKVDFAPRLGNRPAELNGFSGADWLQGGSGNDSLWGESGNDSLYGGNGNDLVVGDWDDTTHTGNDALYGGAGADVMAGLYGDDLLYGGTGDDLFVITETKPGSDRFYGGDGVDALVFLNALGFTSPAIHLSRLILNAAASVEYLYINTSDYTKVFGTADDDVFDLSGTSAYTWAGTDLYDDNGFDLMTGADTFAGSKTKESLFLADGNDRVAMGGGDDRVYLTDGVLGGSTLDGGAGVDVLCVGPIDGSVDAVVSTLSFSLITGFEQVYFSGRLLGTAGNDRWDFTGAPTQFFLTSAEAGAGNDTLLGRADGDNLSGGDGNDSIVGNGGGDNLVGGAGNDSIYGGEGDDNIDASEGLDLVDAGSGNDSVTLSGPITTRVLGGAGTDMLVIGKPAAGDFVVTWADLVRASVQGFEAVQMGVDATLQGTEGNDQLYGGLALTTDGVQALIDLGGGDDFFAAGAEARIYGGAGKDTLSGDGSLFGGIGDDDLSTVWLGGLMDGGEGNDFLYGSDRNDTLIGGAGVDTLYGHHGDDTYQIDSLLDVFYETINDGIDRIVTGLDAFTLGDNFEELQLTRIAGAKGTGNAVDNRLIGGDGADTLAGMDGNDLLSGGAGNDSLVGDAGKDTLYGGAGDDTLVSVKLFEDFVAYDAMDGGEGSDTYWVGLIDPGAVIDTGLSGIDTAKSLVGRYWLTAGFENLIFVTTGVADWGVGNALNNLVKGAELGDQLWGGAGNDTVFGGAGSDTLYGDAGSDVLYGDAENDTLDDGAGAAGDTLYGGAGDDRLTSHGALGSIDLVQGDSGNDLLILATDAVGLSVFKGGEGDDLFDLRQASAAALAGGLSIVEARVGGGKDAIWLAGGIDLALDAIDMNGAVEDVTVRSVAGMSTRVTGNDRGNRLVGWAGAETLDGGLGRDTLTGGAGADAFVLDWRAPAGAASFTYVPDVITDFVHGQDKILIHLDPALIDWQGAGALDPTRFKDLSLAKLDGDDRFFLKHATGQLYYDPDGSGAQSAILLATLGNKPALTADDILFF